MAKQDNPSDPPVDPPDPPKDPPASPPASGDDKAKRREEVKGILAELAQSGEIFGGSGEEPPAGSPEGDALDLEGAISSVLDRREAASKAKEQEQARDQTLTDLREQVSKGLKRVRRWFEPASPYGD